MHHEAVIAYHPDFLGYDFGPQHPLRPERITAGLDLLHEVGIWDSDGERLEPREAPREDLLLVHDAGYVDAVETASSGGFPMGELRRYGFTHGGDNPPFLDMHHAAAMVAAGSSEAVRAIMRGEIAHAFNPAGGLHHAARDRASGFCIYDDPALGAAVAVEEFGARVLYVDFDCHHGDGVQWIFYADPRVLTISFHESGRYLFPGTGDIAELGEGRGYGYSLNVPFEPFTQDDSWLESIRSVLPGAAARFRPDLVISSHGADTHAWDPLTHLSLTTRSFREQAHLVHDLAHEHAEGRWLAVGSGGYDWRRVVPRSWAIVWSEMTGRSLPVGLPRAWLDRWDGYADEPMPKEFDDGPELTHPTPRGDEIDAANRTTVEWLLHALDVGVPG
jgi:acetoin utilization protein AcuC